MSKGSRLRRRAADRARWHERQREKDPTYHTRKVNQSHSRNRPFLGIDGEAIDDRYYLLTAANDQIEEVLEAPPGAELRTGEILSWLVNLPEGPIKVGFWFDYDVNMILVDLEEHHLRQLVRRGYCYWGPFRIKHIPGKLLSVLDRRSRKSAAIWDMSAFVKASFVRMLRAWDIGDEETWNRIDEMKQVRGDFSEEQRAEIRAYNLEECQLLSRASARIRQAAEEAGIRPRTYYGGGSLASELLRRFEIDKYRRNWEDQRHEDAFYGGRFETALVGRYPGMVYVYDINSAYPTALANLPCLAHGHWERGMPRKGEVALQSVSWDLTDLDPVWGPFPHRKTVGSLVYPPDGHGRYWSPEVEAARRHFGKRIKVKASMRWVQACDHQPFWWVGEQAAYRLKLKAQGAFAAQMLKLGLNSIYGKLAQRVGAAPFRTPVWAGLVTSQVRAMLLDALGPDPASVISMSTDSVVSVRPLDHLPLGESLGTWTLDLWEWIFIAQGGVYFWPGDGGVVHKSRGFTGRSLTYPLVSEVWEESGIEGRVPVHQRRFIGYRTGLLRKAPVWRTWLEETRHLSFNPLPRRMPRIPEPDSTYVATDPVPWAIQEQLLDDDRVWYAEDPEWWDSAKLRDLEALEQPDPWYQ